MRLRGCYLKSLSLQELWKLHEEVTVSSLKDLELELGATATSASRGEQHIGPLSVAPHYRAPAF